MCRSIKTLHNFAPPATREEIEAAALQFVRKIAGTRKPSQQNQAPFERAVREITHTTERLLDALVSSAPPKDRDVEAEKARARWQARGR
ncbi:MAG: DUF2277 domain-containing protein [Planctomycetota bacterium]